MSPPQTHGTAPTWPEQSSQLTSTVQETMPLCPSSRQEPLDGVPYPSPEDTNSSVGSLSTLNFTPISVSQPTSFLRQPLNVGHTDSDHDTWPDRLPKRARPDPPYSTDAFGFYGRTGPQSGASGEYSGARALDPGVPLLPDQRPDIPKSSPSGSTPAGELFATLADEQLVPHTSPGNSSTNVIDDPHVHSEGINEPVSKLSSSKRKWRAYLNSVEDNYGFDCGHPDLDLNKNDDHGAIDVGPALHSTSSNRAAGCPEVVNGQITTERHRSGNTRYAYYEFPVPINIPRHLSPLPSALLDNPINLMYFHHYLNHTSRMLVPHDCENNPFISVMPSSESPCTACYNFLLT